MFFNSSFPTEKMFIAAQGPVGGTVSEFYLMMVNNNTKCIVQLTKYHESNRTLQKNELPNKCAIYFPQSVQDSPMNFESEALGMRFEVENVEKTKKNFGFISIIRVTVYDISNRF